MLVRKQSKNAEDFFNRDFKDYRDGFAANGKLWHGIEMFECIQVRLAANFKYQQLEKITK